MRILAMHTKIASHGYYCHSRESGNPFDVINVVVPAQAGTQCRYRKTLDSRFRGNDKLKFVELNPAPKFFRKVQKPMRNLALLISALLILVATVAHALDLPKRKSGLWEMTMIGDQTNGQPQTVTTCVAQKTDTGLSSSFGDKIPKNCKQPTLKKSAGTYIITSSCKFTDSNVKTIAILSGDTNSAYKIDRTSTYTPPNKGRKESKQSITAKWLSACKADQRPGDMIMPDGSKINISDIQKLQNAK